MPWDNSNRYSFCHASSHHSSCIVSHFASQNDQIDDTQMEYCVAVFVHDNIRALSDFGTKEPNKPGKLLCKF